MKDHTKVALKTKKFEPPTNIIAIKRLELLFEIMKKSNAWKSKYEYYQLAKNVNKNSIIVSET